MGRRSTNIVGTRKLVILLLYSVYPMILSSLIWVGYQHVTDGQIDERTDRQTDTIAVANTALCIASNAAAL